MEKDEGGHSETGGRNLLYGEKQEGNNMDEKQATVVMINGVELEIDFLNADELEKFDTSNNKLIKKLNSQETYEGQVSVERMRTQCRLIEEFFEELFGEGTADKLFIGANKNHLGVHADAFAKIVDLARNTPERMRGILGQAPEGTIPMNREQRRAAQYGRAERPQPKHMDNYRDRVAKTEHGLATGSQSDSTEQEGPADEALAELGVTREQFEAIKGMTKGSDGQ